MSHDPASEQDQEDPRWAKLLRAVEGDAPPPDAALLASLRQLSTATFTAAAITSVPAENAATPSEIQTRRRPLMFSLMRGAVAACLAAVLLAIWLTWGGPAPLAAAPSFSKVIAELRKAQTLQLELKQDGDSKQIWVRAPGLVRRQSTPHQYEIAAGSRLWKIDEAANTVTEGDSPWFLDPQQQVDLLGLLDAGIKDASKLLVAKPNERWS